MSETQFDAAPWTAEGVPADEARIWWAYGLSPPQASEWRKAGVSAASAQQLAKAGITPDQAVTHREEDVAILGAAAHFSDKIGDCDPTVAQTYLLERWYDDEAVQWARSGIDAPHARVWAELGLAPSDGYRLISQGETLVSVLRAWWNTRIPLDEVPAWVGAGHSPREAADRYARGLAPYPSS